MPPTSEASLLERLNRLSITRSFTPQVDVEWDETTTDAEYAALYSAWSLLEGTGRDAALKEADRVRFAKYQQMNLMLFTGLLERHGIVALARAYDLDPDDAFAEYLGHFIKEEIYHSMLFQRAVAAIHATMPGAPALPTGTVDRTLRWLFRFTTWLPGRKLQASLAFTIMQFAEQVTIYAHQQMQETVPRRESLVHQVWAFHALDESRHLAFDALILERNRLWRPLAWLPGALAAPCCILLSALLNANELWAARQLGLQLHFWHLPGLVRRTQSPFKRRVFGLMSQVLRGGREAE